MKAVSGAKIIPAVAAGAYVAASVPLSVLGLFAGLTAVRRMPA